MGIHLTRDNGNGVRTYNSRVQIFASAEGDVRIQHEGRRQPNTTQTLRTLIAEYRHRLHTFQNFYRGSNPPAGMTPQMQTEKRVIHNLLKEINFRSDSLGRNIPADLRQSVRQINVHAQRSPLFEGVRLRDTFHAQGTPTQRLRMLTQARAPTMRVAHSATSSTIIRMHAVPVTANPNAAQGGESTTDSTPASATPSNIPIHRNAQRPQQGRMHIVSVQSETPELSQNEQASVRALIIPNGSALPETSWRERIFGNPPRWTPFTSNEQGLIFVDRNDPEYSNFIRLYQGRSHALRATVDFHES